MRPGTAGLQGARLETHLQKRRRSIHFARRVAGAGLAPHPTPESEERCAATLIERCRSAVHAPGGERSGGGDRAVFEVAPAGTAGQWRPLPVERGKVPPRRVPDGENEHATLGLVDDEVQMVPGP